MGIVGNDDVWYIGTIGYASDETTTATGIAQHTNRAEAQWLNLCNAKGFINGLPKFGIGSLPDVHELHIFGHPDPATLSTPTELIDE